MATVTGYKLQFAEKPFQRKPPKAINFSYQERDIVKQEISGLLKKGVIVRSEPEAGEFLSNIFLGKKKDGKSYRVILNLKSLNEFIEYKHLKMETVHTAIRLIRKGCLIASVDLKDAYYTVPVDKSSQKYLKFEFEGVLYQFVALPNGLASAPRVFTKLLKPVYSKVRKAGHVSTGFIDYSLLIEMTDGGTIGIYWQQLRYFRVWDLLYPDKSVLYPTHDEITYLGWVHNSLSMTVALTGERSENLVRQCQNMLRTDQPTIREVAELSGTLNASILGIKYAKLYHKQIEIEKSAALKHAK